MNDTLKQNEHVLSHPSVSTTAHAHGPPRATTGPGKSNNSPPYRLQRQREAVDDGAQDLQHLSNAIVPLVLKHKPCKRVPDSLPNEAAVRHELSCNVRSTHVDGHVAEPCHNGCQPERHRDKQPPLPPLAAVTDRIFGVKWSSGTLVPSDLPSQTAQLTVWKKRATTTQWRQVPRARKQRKPTRGYSDTVHHYSYLCAKNLVDAFLRGLARHKASQHDSTGDEVPRHRRSFCGPINRRHRAIPLPSPPPKR